MKWNPCENFIILRMIFNRGKRTTLENFNTETNNPQTSFITLTSFLLYLFASTVVNIRVLVNLKGY